MKPNSRLYPLGSSRGSSPPHLGAAAPSLHSLRRHLSLRRSTPTCARMVQTDTTSASSSPRLLSTFGRDDDGDKPWGRPVSMRPDAAASGLRDRPAPPGGEGAVRRGAPDQRREQIRLAARGNLAGASPGGSGLDGRGTGRGNRTSGLWSARGGEAAAYCMGDDISRRALGLSPNSDSTKGHRWFRWRPSHNNCHRGGKWTGEMYREEESTMRLRNSIQWQKRTSKSNLKTRKDASGGKKISINDLFIEAAAWS